MPKNLKQLVSDVISKGFLSKKSLIESFLKIDRKDFVPKRYQDEAYEDHPIPIGYGQTISQPSTVAFMMELLDPKNADSVLDIGSGSGWTTALLGNIVGQKGRVLGIERVPQLVTQGRKNLSKYNIPQTRIEYANDHLGMPREAPFDRILVSAGSQTMPPELIKQLRVSGIMVIPIGQSIFKIQKISPTKIATLEFPGFLFVPLIEKCSSKAKQTTV